MQNDQRVYEAYNSVLTQVTIGWSFFRCIANVMHVNGCDNFLSKREIGLDSSQSQCMVLRKIGAQAYLHAWLVLSVRARVIVRPFRLFDHLCSNILNRICASAQKDIHFRCFRLRLGCSWWSLWFIQSLLMVKQRPRGVIVPEPLTCPYTRTFHWRATVYLHAHRLIFW
jgi:hypothetical protein